MPNDAPRAIDIEEHRCPICGVLLWAVETPRTDARPAQRAVSYVDFTCAPCLRLQRTHSLSTRYTVFAADRAGEFDSWRTDVLLVAKRVRDEWREKYPDKVVDICDQERDGAVLDEEEV